MVYIYDGRTVLIQGRRGNGVNIYDGRSALYRGGWVAGSNSTT